MWSLTSDFVALPRKKMLAQERMPPHVEREYPFREASARARATSVRYAAQGCALKLPEVLRRKSGDFRILGDFDGLWGIL